VLVYNNLTFVSNGPVELSNILMKAASKSWFAFLALRFWPGFVEFLLHKLYERWPEYEMQKWEAVFRGGLNIRSIIKAKTKELFFLYGNPSFRFLIISLFFNV